MKSLLSTLLLSVLAWGSLALADTINLKRELMYSRSAEKIQELVTEENLSQLSAEEQNDILCFQCNRSSADIINALLDAGLRLTPNTDKSYSCYDSENILSRLYDNEHLTQNQLLSLSQQLIQAGATMNNNAMRKACGLHNKELVDFCLQEGASINGEADSLISPLGMVCFQSKPSRSTQQEPKERRERQVALAQRLIALGADVNGRPNTIAPLNAVSIKGDIELITLLLKHGADVNAGHMQGITPLQDACSAFAPPETLQLLIDAGANVNQYDHEGNNPLIVACLFNQREKVAILLQHGADANIGLKFDFAEITIPIILVPAFGAACNLYDAPLDWNIPYLLFKAQNIWYQLGTILGLLILIAIPILGISGIIFGIKKFIRLRRSKRKV